MVREWSCHQYRSLRSGGPNHKQPELSFQPSKAQHRRKCGASFDLRIIKKIKMCTWASTRACSTSIRASAVRPLQAHPICRSISKIFSMLDGTIRGDVILFSTANRTPSLVWMPIAVEPSYPHHESKFNWLTIFTLMASIAYSTWKRRPSGLKVFTPRSYSPRLRYMTDGPGEPPPRTKIP